MNFNNAIKVVSGSRKQRLFEKNYIYLGRIVPNRMVEKKQVYEITYLDELCVINGFNVVTENDKVMRVQLYGFHPNRDDNGLYCLPEGKKNVPFTEDYFHMLKTNIKTYYLDASYFRPEPKIVKYKKLKSIYFQLNQGE